MAKTILLTLILLGSSAWMVAQSSPTSPSDAPQGSGGTTGQATSGDQHSGMNGNETTIKGCLTSSGSNYVLTDSSGMHYQLQGSTSKLSSHVNQQVQVRGTSSGAGSETSTGTQGTGTATTRGANSTQPFNVSKVKKIADSCTSSK